MRKTILLAITLIVSVIAFAQEEQDTRVDRDFTVLKGLSFGVGIPIECRDLPGAGVTLNIG